MDRKNPQASEHMTAGGVGAVACGACLPEAGEAEQPRIGPESGLKHPVAMLLLPLSLEGHRYLHILASIGR